jgi:hypothetical protein
MKALSPWGMRLAGDLFMIEHALSQWGIAVAAAPAAEAVATAVDQPAVGHVLAYAIAVTAFLVIGALLFFWQWNRPRPSSR